MQIVQYAAEHFERLQAAARGSGAARSLQHRLFVEHYYNSRDWCRLYLVLERDGAVAAAMGLEQIPFCYDSRRLLMGCASNFVAFRPGAGGYLFLHWIKSSDFACVYGGSRDTHAIVRNQKWTYFAGVKSLHLNRRYPSRPGEPLWKRTAKSVLRAVGPRVDPRAWPARLARDLGAHLSVREEQRFTEDMLPEHSPFAFRMCPTTEYLNWRYNTSVPFVGYRLFRILADGVTVGYAVLNERPERVIVAQCDGTDPARLAAGVLLALAAAAAQHAAREVLLTCAHTQMQTIFREYGFRAASADRPLAIGSRRHAVDLAADTSRWLINFDWIDNGLRPPFLDDTATPGAGEPAADFEGDAL